VSDEESEEVQAKVRGVSLGTDGTTVIDSIKPGQGKLPISKCPAATAGPSMTDNDFCSDALWVVPNDGPGSALADGTNAVKGVPDGKVRIEYYAEDAGTTPACAATVDVVKTDLEICKPRVIDSSESMIPDADEEAIGSATFVSPDDDDGDGMFDYNPDGGVNDPAVPNDDELLRAKLRLQPKELPSGTAKLVATAGAKAPGATQPCLARHRRAAVACSRQFPDVPKVSYRGGGSARLSAKWTVLPADLRGRSMAPAGQPRGPLGLSASSGDSFA
jgi:hypothetical protein